MKKKPRQKVKSEDKVEKSSPSVNGRVSTKSSRTRDASKEKPESPNPKQVEKTPISGEKRKSVANKEETPVKRLRQSNSSSTPKAQSKETKKTPSKTPTKKPNVYEVEKIVGKRTKKGKEQFLIKWVGYPESDNSWEPKKNLDNCKELLENFLNNQD